MTTYQNAWPVYRPLGWLGTLPLPPGKKLPPPKGFTGRDGVDPSGPDCYEFEQDRLYRGTRQLALRMPDVIIGLDKDGYAGRTGAETFDEAARRWEVLPTGPWSSARDDGSGIFFFRVPADAVLVSEVKFPELHLGNVEIIRRCHRYAVVWPSVHPKTGAAYTWRGTAGQDVPPAVADLPDLPAAWLDGLRPCPPARMPVSAAPSSAQTSRGALAGVIRWVLDAPSGQRNTRLNWGAFRMFEKVAAGQLDATAAEAMLSDAATAIQLGATEARATIASARRAVLGA